MTREMGKPLAETRGDVQEGIDTAYYAATMGRQLFGRTVPSELRAKWAMSYRRPIGVCGIITPFNFPMAIPTWKMFPALLCGNACVFKPAEDVPHTGTVLVEILLEAGLPPEVIQLVHGDGRGRRGDRGASRDSRRVVHRLDGDRRLDRRGMRAHAQAAVARRWAARMPDRSGRRRSRPGARRCALGRVRHDGPAMHRDVASRCSSAAFTNVAGARSAIASQALRLGDGRKPGTNVGPLIHAASREKVERIRRKLARSRVRSWSSGGKRATGAALECGWFYQPTIFAGVKPGSRLEQEEIFGPVLSVIRVDTADEAFAVNNDVRYGLSSSVYTRDVNLAFRALAELDNGITYINAPTIGAEAHLPFGGVKQTGNGHREGGWEVYDFYSETKVGYVDFSGTLQRAQIDTYLGAPD